MESALNSVLDNVNWVTAILALVVCVVFYVYIQWINMLPGPTGLPYLGYYPFLGRNYHLQLNKLSKKYGDVFFIRCAGQLYVYLGSNQAIREAHVTKSDCFSRRPSRYSLLTDSFGDGMILMNGEEWKDMRKFLVQRLREFGLGKKTQESLMGDLLENTVNTIRKTNGENFDALSFFTNMCGKVMCSMLLSGSKLDENDINMINGAYAIVTESFLGKRALFGGPLLTLMLYLHPEFRRYRKNKLVLYGIFEKIVEEHEKDFDKDNIRDFVDCYVNMRKELEEKGDPRSKIYTGKCLQINLMQFVGDGGFSVGFLVALILKELYSRPEMQREMQREIDNIVGRSCFPSWDDRSRMPYTNAFIQECFRFMDVFPALPSLECTKETTIADCQVPKGAVSLVSFWGLFHDRDVYEEPEKFDPTRFMPSDDERKPKADLPLLFGVGRRSCVGETIVVMQAFLFVTTVLQNFDLYPPKERELTEGDSPPKKKEMEEYNIVFRATPRAS